MFRRRTGRITPITQQEPPSPSITSKIKPRISRTPQPFIEPPGLPIAKEIVPSTYGEIELFTRKPKTSNRNHSRLFKPLRIVELDVYRNNDRQVHGIIRGLITELDIYNRQYMGFLSDIKEIDEKYGSLSLLKALKTSGFKISIEELKKSIFLITKDVYEVYSMKYLSYQEIAVILVYIQQFIKYYFPTDNHDKLNNIRRLYSCQCFFYMLFTSFGIDSEIINRLIENMRNWDYTLQEVLYENFYLYCELILLFTPLNFMNVYKIPVERSSFYYTEDIQFFINKLSLLNICFYNSNRRNLDLPLQKLIGIDKKMAVIVSGGNKHKKQKKLKKYN